MSGMAAPSLAQQALGRDGPRVARIALGCVTTLPAKAGSFSGDARPNGPRYRLTARSKPVVLGKHLKAQRLDQHCTHLVTRQ